MAATSGRRGDVGRDTEIAPTALADEHLLLVPSSTPAEVVAEFVAARVDDADLASGSAQVGRRSAIAGPVHLTPEAAAAAGVPGAWDTAYRLVAPRERDAGAYALIADAGERARWQYAFPDGRPYREEGDLVALGLELARRLSGALRVAGTNAVLVPDPDRDVDLSVWSRHWVDAERLLGLLAPVLRDARVDRPDPVGSHRAPPGDVDLWTIDPADPRAEERHRELDLALTDDLLNRIDEHAETADARALAAPDILDGYAIAGDGGVTIGVRREGLVPAWIRGRIAEQDGTGPIDGPTGDGVRPEPVAVANYDVRWWPFDLSQLGLENPTIAHRIAREQVRPVMRACARVIAEATHGLVLDAGGFPIDRYELL